MALIPYKQLLTAAKEVVDAALAPLRAREMRKKAELEVVQLEGKVMEKDTAIQEACSKYPIDFGSIIKLQDEKALLERRSTQLGVIITEMFPTE